MRDEIPNSQASKTLVVVADPTRSSLRTKDPVSRSSRKIMSYLKFLSRGVPGELVDNYLCLHRCLGDRMLSQRFDLSTIGKNIQVLTAGDYKNPNRPNTIGHHVSATFAATTTKSSSLSTTGATKDSTMAVSYPIIKQGKNMLYLKEKSLVRATKTITERHRLESTLETGIAIIDALAPIGRGASMLLIGNSETNIDSLKYGIAKGSLESESVEVVIDAQGKVSVGEGSVDAFTTSDTVPDVWHRLATADDISESGKHVLCFVDLNEMSNIWDRGQELLQKELQEEELASSTATIGDTAASESSDSTMTDNDSTASTGSTPNNADYRMFANSSFSFDSSNNTSSENADPTAPVGIPTDLPEEVDVSKSMKEKERVIEPESRLEQAKSMEQQMSHSMGPGAVQQTDRTAAATGEKRGFFSQITERAANLKTGGSVTVVLTVNREIVGLPTVRELQSLSDGHIWLGGDSSEQREEKLKRNAKKEAKKLELLKEMRKGATSEEMKSSQAASVSQTDLESAAGITNLDANCIDYRKSLTRFGLGSHNQFLRRNKSLQKIAGHLRLCMSNMEDISLHQADRHLFKLMDQVDSVFRNQVYSANLPIQEEIILLLAASTIEMPDPDVTLRATTYDMEKAGEVKKAPSTSRDGDSTTGCNTTSLLHYLRTSNPQLLEKVKEYSGEGKVNLAKEISMNIQIFIHLYKASAMQNDGSQMQSIESSAPKQASDCM